LPEAQTLTDPDNWLGARNLIGEAVAEVLLRGIGADVAERTRRGYTVITVAARTRIVRIGNSRGIRIPKTLLDEADLPEEVELHAQPGRLIVQAVRRPRSGWANAAKRMRTRGDDAILDESTTTKFDRAEWKWPKP
jgi:antitoxin MazE